MLMTTSQLSDVSGGQAKCTAVALSVVSADGALQIMMHPARPHVKQGFMVQTYHLSYNVLLVLITHGNQPSSLSLSGC